MKKNIRKFFASITAILVLSISFASCGSIDEDSSIVTENTTTTGEIVTTEKTTSTSTTTNETSSTAKSTTTRKTTSETTTTEKATTTTKSASETTTTKNRDTTTTRDNTPDPDPVPEPTNTWQPPVTTRQTTTTERKTTTPRPTTTTPKPTTTTTTTTPKPVDTREPVVSPLFFVGIGKNVSIFDENYTNYYITSASISNKSNDAYVSFSYNSSSVSVQCNSEISFDVQINWYNSELGKSITTSTYVEFF